MQSAQIDKKFRIHNFLIDINTNTIPKLIKVLVKNYDNVQVQQYENLFNSFDYRSQFTKLTKLHLDEKTLQELFILCINFVAHTAIQIDGDFKLLAGNSTEYIITTIMPFLINDTHWDKYFLSYYGILQPAYIEKFDSVCKFLMRKYISSAHSQNLLKFIKLYCASPVITGTLINMTGMLARDNSTFLYQEFYEGKYFINATINTMNNEAFDYFNTVAGLYLNNKDFYRALQWCKVYKNKIVKINNIHKVNQIVLTFALDLVLNEYRDNLFDHDKEDVYSALLEIRKSNSFKLLLSLLHEYDIPLNNLTYFQNLVYAYAYNKVNENLKQFRRFRLKDLNIKFDSDFISIIGGNASLNNVVLQAFRVYDARRTLDLQKDVFELTLNAPDLNLVAAETGALKAVTKSIKDYKMLEHITESTNILSSNANFNSNLEDLYKIYDV